MSQLERVYYINRKIDRNGFVTVKEVASMFEVSTRTIKRDIEYMRDRLSVNMNYSAKVGGYVYSEKFNFLKNIDEKMLIFYSFIKGIMKNYNYIPILSEDILTQISKVSNKTYNRISDMIIYELNEFEKIDFSLFEIIFESVINKKQLIIGYESNSGKKSERAIEPVKLINYSGKWYLLAYCHSSEEYRLFLLSRIIKIKETDEQCIVKPDKNKISKYLNSGFGIYKSAETTDVKIRFYDNIFYIVKDQIWHENQKIKIGKDAKGNNFLDLTIPVSNSEEIVGKVLRYGGSAEILEPVNFRNIWLAEIKRMYDRFI